MWTANGFRDSFNLRTPAAWYDSDELGIDQGPIVIMIENDRNQHVWDRFMQNPEIQRGLQRAGFVPLPNIALTVSAPTGSKSRDAVMEFTSRSNLSSRIFS